MRYSEVDDKVITPNSSESTPTNQPVSPSNEHNWIQNASRNEWIKVASSHESSFFTLNSYDDFSICECITELDEGLLLSMEKEKLLVVDVTKRELIRVDGVDLRGIRHNQILDLSDEGDRWEGDVLNGEPCGWGVLYDKDNRRVYEGFRLNYENVCYGTSYYSDIERVEYEGELFKGMRWGRGVEYDRNGTVVYDGKWLGDDRWENRADKRVVLNPPTPFFNSVEELVVSDGSCNDASWRVLDVHLMPFLKVLRVGRLCFKTVNEVRLIGLRALEQVDIGQKCFDEGEGSLIVRGCPLLQRLTIGYHSFPSYSLCIIEENPLLFSVSIGFYAFTKSLLVLRDLEAIESVTLENGVFEHTLHSVIESSGWSWG